MHATKIYDVFYYQIKVDDVYVNYGEHKFSAWMQQKI